MILQRIGFFALVVLIPAVSVFAESKFSSSDIVIVQGQNDDYGIPHFRQVTDQIYRGGRPENYDLPALQKGTDLRTVINLENKPQIVEREKQKAKQLGLQFFSVPMSADERPTDQQINEALNQLKDPLNFPVYIHCFHGQDRTGLIVGLYRVEVQGWAPDKAYDEMKSIGFHPSLTGLDSYFRDRTGLK